VRYITLYVTGGTFLGKTTGYVGAVFPCSMEKSAHLAAPTPHLQIATQDE
jgi:hypothetical protein